MSENPDIRYGRILEGVHIAGYSAQRALDETQALSESGEWEQIDGSRFAGDYSGFIRSIPFGKLRPSDEQIEAFENLAHVNGASNRAIGKATGQHGTTVGRHLDGAADAADQETDTSPEQDIEDTSTINGAADAADQGTDTSPEQDEQDSLPIDEPAAAPKQQPTITLYTHEGTPVEYPEPKGKASFNETTGEGISWASWSWNPVTGCLHGCKYCYARELATSERLARSYPAGFTPLFHPERLDAPSNTTIPERYANHPDPFVRAAYRRVFVCSMADLYGKWVPDEWIDKVHASMLASPDWEYLLLTKFPSRYNKVELPLNAWVGTSVDDQRRVPIAENAFRKIDGVKVKWLSLEPLLAPLEFTDLSMFDWVVIGAQTETRQPDGVVPAFKPPFDWVVRVYQQAREAGCRVHFKPNLSHGPGMEMPNEYPVA